MSVDLAFEAVGAGPPILILHGLFGSRTNWRGIARKLSGSHRVLTVDLRNHGTSPWAGSMDYVEMAGDVLKLIEREGLERPSLIGHSMGGKVAMALALSHPQRIDRLIVVDIAPVAYAARLSAVTEAMRMIDTLHAAGRAEMRLRMAETLPHAWVTPFLMQIPVARNAHLDWRINFAAIGAAMPALSGFPTALRDLRFERALHVIAGGRSDYVRRADAAEFLPMFERTRVEVVESAGHWVHADQPEAFIVAVQRALYATAPACRH